MKTSRKLVPDHAVADMSFLGIWRNALLVNPPLPGRYVVSVSNLAHNSQVVMRRWSGAKWETMDAFVGTERVSHWLEGLREPIELLREAVRDEIERGRR